MKRILLATAAITLIAFSAPAHASNNVGAAGASSTGVGAGVNTGLGINADIGASGSASGTSSTETGTMDDAGVTGNASASGGASVDMPANMNSSQFSTFATGSWDSNGDGIVSSGEWDAASPTWFGSNLDAETRSFATWDVNRNGTLDTNELNTVFSTSGLYQIYDTNGNGMIDNTESARIPR
jgi:hypothetical protein